MTVLYRSVSLSVVLFLGCSTPTTLESVDQSSSGLSAKLVATLEQPIALVPIPLSEVLLAVERGGLVRPMYPNQDGTFRVGKPILDLTGEVGIQGEGGLLGLAISTDGSKLYVNWTDSNTTTHIEEYLFSLDSLTTSSRRTLLILDQPYQNHNGGHLLVDEVGNLLVGFGDGGYRDDPFDHSQNPETFFGTIIRIDPRLGNPYGIPQTNPFIDMPNRRAEILVWGLRNPWKFSIDRTTGDLWIADVGQDQIEEVTRIPAEEIDLGLNLGWPALEGDQLTGKPEPQEHRLPDIVYTHQGTACSVTGGHVYRGKDIPDLNGIYLFGDFCDGLLRLAEQQVDGTVKSWVTNLEIPLLVAFGEDNYGESYLISLLGGIYRIG